MKPWVLVSLLKDDQEYQRAQAADARAVAAREGLDVRVAICDCDPGRQVQQITAATTATDKPVAIVTETAGSVGFERVARTGLQAGVGWVVVSDSPRYLDALHREFPSRLVAATAVSNEEMGRQMARVAKALLPAGGKLLVCEGPTATAATLQRRRALEDELRGTKLLIVKTLGSDWTAANAEKVTATWLRLAGKSAPKPDLLVSMNDEMATGVLQAIKAVHPEWGRITAMGCDGLPEGGQRLVREGILAATIVMPATAGQGIELVAKHMRGEPVPVIVTVPTRTFPPLEQLSPGR